MFKRIPGTKDILPEEALEWQKAEETARSVFSLYNFQEIRFPIIEEAPLFNRSLGEATEVVQKQMFLIKREDELYALRPEGTACVVRAYLENSLDKTVGFAKFYYTGPMFRMERPQKGRLRQFHHIGCEVIGSFDASADIEVIALADALLKKFPISGYKIKLNSLGCPEDKKGFTEELRRVLSGKINKLCADCQERFKNNVLRILDCKNEACQEIVRGLDIRDQHLCADCRGHFTQVKEGLDICGIDYEVSPYLVRGLDYYTRTVFEITHQNLGAQDAIGAGGRYDNLVAELGGASTGATGFAMGVERLLLAAERKSPVADKKLVYIITLGAEAKKQGIRISQDLRREGIACDSDHTGKSLKGAMRAANDAQAAKVLIIGDDEIKKKAVMLKDMLSGEQEEIRQEELIARLKGG